MDTKVALITGAAQRIGANIAQHLHAQGYQVILHYRHSQAAAAALVAECNQQRAQSATAIVGDLANVADYERMIAESIDAFGRLDVLVNNASSFIATPIGEATPAHWDDLFASNAKGPFFLSQAAVPYLRQVRGNIINITDIHAQRPLRGYSIYAMAKASLSMLTKVLAKELAPEIRVNAVAPGAILWPESGQATQLEKQQAIVAKIPLQRQGDPQDIANAVSFLAASDYVTGQILAIDGGRSLS